MKEAKERENNQQRYTNYRKQNPSHPISLTIKLQTGKSLPLILNSGHYILNIKALIQVHEGIKIEDLKLYFEGQKLLDDLTIKSYHIENGNKLTVVDKNTLNDSSDSERGGVTKITKVVVTQQVTTTQQAYAMPTQ